MKKRFESHREYWLNIFICAVIALGATPLIQTVLRGGTVTLALVFAAGVVAILAVVLFRSYSEFHKDYLLVVNGPVMERYYYRDITGIKTTKGNWLAGQVPRARFALFSNHMLRRYISPRDWEAFLKYFKEKCPDATVD